MKNTTRTVIYRIVGMSACALIFVASAPAQYAPFGPRGSEEVYFDDSFRYFPSVFGDPEPIVQTNYVRYSNTAIAGYNRTRISTSSISRCQSECNKYSWCTSFEYHKKGKYCNLQFGNGRRGANGDYDLYVKSSTGSSGGSVYTGSYARRANSIIAGYNRRRLNNTSIQACVNECNKFSWCTSFEYQKADRFCNLQFGNGRISGDRNYDLYIKSGGSSAGNNNPGPSGRPACGLGTRWDVVDTNGLWNGVWTRRGSSNVFSGRWTSPGESAVTATLNISISGSSVKIFRTDNANRFGTKSCTYSGKFLSGGLNVQGTVICNTNVGRLGPFNWSARISCGGTNNNPNTGSATRISWTSNPYGLKLRGGNGRRYQYLCPSNGRLRSVWGTIYYTDDSSICTAAVHAGLITRAGGGYVTIEIRGGRKSFTASRRNGVNSRGYGSWGGSFVFVR